jgi:hypothetical protein
VVSYVSHLWVSGDRERNDGITMIIYLCGFLSFDRSWRRWFSHDSLESSRTSSRTVCQS